MEGFDLVQLVMMRLAQTRECVLFLLECSLKFALKLFSRLRDQSIILYNFTIVFISMLFDQPLGCLFN